MSKSQGPGYTSDCVLVAEDGSNRFGCSGVPELDLGILECQLYVQLLHPIAALCLGTGCDQTFCRMPCAAPRKLRAAELHTIYCKRAVNSTWLATFSVADLTSQPCPVNARSCRASAALTKLFGRRISDVGSPYQGPQILPTSETHHQSNQPAHC